MNTIGKMSKWKQFIRNFQNCITDSQLQSQATYLDDINLSSDNMDEDEDDWVGTESDNGSGEGNVDVIMKTLRNDVLDIIKEIENQRKPSWIIYKLDTLENNIRECFHLHSSEMKHPIMREEVLKTQEKFIVHLIEEIMDDVFQAWDNMKKNKKLGKERSINSVVSVLRILKKEVCRMLRVLTMIEQPYEKNLIFGMKSKSFNESIFEPPQPYMWKENIKFQTRVTNEINVFGSKSFSFCPSKVKGPSDYSCDKPSMGHNESKHIDFNDNSNRHTLQPNTPNYHPQQFENNDGGNKNKSSAVDHIIHFDDEYQLSETEYDPAESESELPESEYQPSESEYHPSETEYQLPESESEMSEMQYQLPESMSCLEENVSKLAKREPKILESNYYLAESQFKFPEIQLKLPESQSKFPESLYQLAESYVEHSEDEYHLAEDGSVAEHHPISDINKVNTTCVFSQYAQETKSKLPRFLSRFVPRKKSSKVKQCSSKATSVENLIASQLKIKQPDLSDASTVTEEIQMKNYPKRIDSGCNTISFPKKQIDSACNTNSFYQSGIDSNVTSIPSLRSMNFSSKLYSNRKSWTLSSLNQGKCEKNIISPSSIKQCESVPAIQMIRKLSSPVGNDSRPLQNSYSPQKLKVSQSCMKDAESLMHSDFSRDSDSDDTYFSCIPSEIDFNFTAIFEKLKTKNRNINMETKIYSCTSPKLGELERNKINSIKSTTLSSNRLEKPSHGNAPGFHTIAYLDENQNDIQSLTPEESDFSFSSLPNVDTRTSKNNNHNSSVETKMSAKEQMQGYSYISDSQFSNLCLSSNSCENLGLHFNV